MTLAPVARSSGDVTGRAPVMDRLRTETRPAHDSTEAIPFSKAMMEQRLPKDRYIGQLAAYAVVHRALDGALAASTHPAVAAVWADDLAKTPLLERDLRYFAPELTDTSAEAMRAAHAFADAIADLARRDPVALLGYLYVLEGSTLGATILRGHIAATYGLDLDSAEGLAYYSPYGNAVMPHWKLFKERMNAAVVDAGEQDRVVAAASEAFRRIGDILRALSAGLA